MKLSTTKLSTILLITFLCFPGVAFASHHVFQCSELTGSNISCSGNVWTFTSTSAVMEDHSVFQLGNHVTGYVTYRLTGTGDKAQFTCYSQNDGCAGYNPQNGSYTDVTISTGAFNNPNNWGFHFSNNEYSGSSNFVGTVDSICLADTAGECPTPSGGGGGGGGGGSASSTPIGGQILAGQLDDSVVTKIWDQTQLNSAYQVQNVSYVSIGTPFSQDVTIAGFEVYAMVTGDGTANAGFTPSLAYADTGQQICGGGLYYDNSVGTTSVDVRGTMQKVFIRCGDTNHTITGGNSMPIDHNRPLILYNNPMGTGGAAQSGLYTRGSNTQIYYQIIGTEAGASYVATSILGQTGYDAITTVVPRNQQTVATSSSFVLGASGYISPGHYVSGHTNIYFCLQSISNNLTQIEIAPSVATYCNFSTYVPILAAGNFNIVATTSIPIAGLFTLKTNLTVPSYTSFFGIAVGSNTLVATSTWFTVSTSTQIERDSLAQLSLLGVVTADASTTGSSYCGVLDFNALKCAIGFFIVDSGGVAQIQGLMGQLSQKWPWGYATRSVALISGTASSSCSGLIVGNGECSLVGSALPSLVIPISQIPGAQGISDIDLTPWGKLMGGTSLLATATSTHSGSTFRQIVEPGWDFLVVFLFGMGMLAQLLGFPLPHDVEVQMDNQRRRNYSPQNRTQRMRF